ncbi:hypothetical protein EJ08DRAFT_459099 [Tothia fuscella]|uniref:Uncharacterized protein n=1 Tax=Tothia fuscella TaxID=1048955 RepID=A0A9P4NIC6_9PEZI|nr:hypothetical protein EJ08DRAFT_459099 [Tothia fuscella]
MSEGPMSNLRSPTPVLFSTGLLDFLADRRGETRERPKTYQNSDTSIRSTMVDISVAKAEHSLQDQSAPRSVEIGGKDTQLRSQTLCMEPIGTCMEPTGTCMEPIGTYAYMGNTSHESPSLLWPTIGALGFTVVAFYAARTSFRGQEFALKPLTLRPSSASSNLLYSSLAANVVCSGALVYACYQHRTGVTPLHLVIPTTWEDALTRHASSQLLNLRKQYQSQSESLANQHARIVEDIQLRWQNIKVAQAVALADISRSQNASQRKIRKGESSVWDAARQAEHASKGLRNDLLSLEAENTALNRRLKEAEYRLDELTRQATKFTRRKEKVD